MSEDNYSLSSRVFHTIRENILSGKYATDEELKEKSIGEELGVSRTPVREALRQLENEGIVEYTRNVGCSVRTFSFWDSYEVYLLRTNYEAVSVRFLNGLLILRLIICRLRVLLVRMMLKNWPRKTLPEM